MIYKSTKKFSRERTEEVWRLCGRKSHNDRIPIVSLSLSLDIYYDRFMVRSTDEASDCGVVLGGEDETGAQVERAINAGQMWRKHDDIFALKTPGEGLIQGGAGGWGAVRQKTRAKQIHDLELGAQPLRRD